jgi:hypothetical protein
MNLWLLMFTFGFLGLVTLSGMYISSRRRQDVSPMIYVEND